MPVMNIKLSAPPYAIDALEPFISVRSMSLHYWKIHQGHVDTVNRLADNPQLSGKSIEQLIREGKGGTRLLDNAAQVWNHDFFWKSMKCGGGGRPNEQLLKMIERSFGSLDCFKEAFVLGGVLQLGSGWVWLIQEGSQLEIISTSNTDTPLAHGQNPLLVCDLWEHAYYLDYQNRRRDFLQMFADHLINWNFAVSQLKGKASLP